MGSPLQALQEARLHKSPASNVRRWSRCRKTRASSNIDTEVWIIGLRITQKLNEKNILSKRLGKFNLYHIRVGDLTSVRTPLYRDFEAK